MVSHYLETKGPCSRAVFNVDVSIITSQRGYFVLKSKLQNQLNINVGFLPFWVQNDSSTQREYLPKLQKYFKASRVAILEATGDSYGEGLIMCQKGSTDSQIWTWSSWSEYKYIQENKWSYMETSTDVCSKSWLYFWSTNWMRSLLAWEISWNLYGIFEKLRQKI